MSLPVPPKAKKVPFEITTHGDTRIDPYYWLRDMERQDPEILAHLEAENAYTKAVMSDTETLQEALFDELKGRIKQTDESVPYHYHGYFYYTRFEEGREYAIHCRRKGSMEATEEIMLDVNVLAADFSYYQLGTYAVSPDNRFVAFSEDTVSRRVYTLRFKDLGTGMYLDDRIEGISGGCVWTEDNTHVFYVAKDPQTLRSYKVFRHKMGTAQQDDVEIFHEEDATFNVGVGKSKSRRWIYIHSSATVSDEFRILPANEPMGQWKLFQPRQRDLEYGIAHFEDHFYILTNHQAENFRLMRTHEDSTELSHWSEVIPHRSDVLLEDVDVFTHYLVLSEKKAAQNSVRIINWKSGEEHYISFEEEVYHVTTGVNPEFDTDLLRLGYQSMTTPVSVLEYNMLSRERTLLKEQEILGGFDRNNYVTKRLWITARDGERVPVSMVYRRGTMPSAETPLLLYGYGSYGINIDPYFSPSRLSLLDRGFIFAIAHIRGSQMMGRRWYEQGKMLRKLNTFHDFIDCAEFLIEEGFTSAAHLYAMGGSAGGLLMGAVINMRPDLWKGVVAAVPFVDVVTTMLDESIPLTTGEFDEWGNPQNEEYYHYIKQYSPYDNIEAKDYPNLLVTTGLHDSQVQYWEPAKWVARLRERKTDDNLLLFHINMEFGHSGASGRFEVYREIALEYAFFLKLEGKGLTD